MIKRIIKYFSFTVVTILIGVTTVYAGSLTPPGSVLNTMYSLTDLYNLASGTTVSVGSGALPATPGTVSATFHSITEVYEAIAGQIDNLTAGTIATGTTAFGLTGTMQAGLPKTGSTRCLGSFNDGFSWIWGEIPCEGTKQDGDPVYRKGVARSYTDNGDGTITDNVTGLMWQKCSAGQNATDCTGTATQKQFDNGAGAQPAIDYCEGLSLATRSDWRLPNILELESIIDFGAASPSISPMFLNAQASGYWSSTVPQAALGNSVWVVDFSEGLVQSVSMESLGYYVRCVRN